MSVLSAVPVVCSTQTLSSKERVKDTHQPTGHDGLGTEQQRSFPALFQSLASHMLLGKQVLARTTRVRVSLVSADVKLSW